MEQYLWYQELIKPSWAPPAFLFGPVWSVLYTLIAISFGYVFYLFFRKRLPFVVALPFALNLLFNLLFSPIQFGFQNLFFATVDIFLVLGTLIWALIAIYPYARFVVYVNIPYFVWVSFATVLQVSVMILNW